MPTLLSPQTHEEVLQAKLKRWLVPDERKGLMTLLGKCILEYGQRSLLGHASQKARAQDISFWNPRERRDHRMRTFQDLNRDSAYKLCSLESLFWALQNIGVTVHEDEFTPGQLLELKKLC